MKRVRTEHCDDCNARGARLTTIDVKMMFPLLTVRRQNTPLAFEEQQQTYAPTLALRTYLTLISIGCVQNIRCMLTTGSAHP